MDQDGAMLADNGKITISNHKITIKVHTLLMRRSIKSHRKTQISIPQRIETPKLIIKIWHSCLK